MRRSFVVLWTERQGASRIAFAVSRGVGGSVRRNRVRRRLREAYRQAQAGLPAGRDVVLIGRPAALTQPFGQILDEMRRAFTFLSSSGARQGYAPR